MKKFYTISILSLLAMIFWQCTPLQPVTSITSEQFGTMPDGTSIELYTLTNTHGMRVKITNYGGIITNLFVTDRNGEIGDVVLGYDNLDSYVKSNPFFGAIVGRYGNRIAGGKFTLNGETFSLVQNNGVNHLHGGTKGFDKVVWQATPATGRSSCSSAC